MAPENGGQNELPDQLFLGRCRPATGWPDAEFGTWQFSPSRIEFVEGWSALDYADDDA